MLSLVSSHTSAVLRSLKKVSRPSLCDTRGVDEKNALTLSPLSSTVRTGTRSTSTCTISWKGTCSAAVVYRPDTWHLSSNVAPRQNVFETSTVAQSAVRNAARVTDTPTSTRTVPCKGSALAAGDSRWCRGAADAAPGSAQSTAEPADRRVAHRSAANPSHSCRTGGSRRSNIDTGSRHTSPMARSRVVGRRAPAYELRRSRVPHGRSVAGYR
jgi:hypothetical protein